MKTIGIERIQRWLVDDCREKSISMWIVFTRLGKHASIWARNATNYVA